jgi:hypothetical protein
MDRLRSALLLAGCPAVALSRGLPGARPGHRRIAVVPVCAAGTGVRRRPVTGDALALPPPPDKTLLALVILAGAVPGGTVTGLAAGASAARAGTG